MGADEVLLNRLLVHQPKIMLGVLTAVLRFDRVTGQRSMTRERHVALVDPLGIGKIVGSIPSRCMTLEALPIRSRAPAALSSSKTSHWARRHGQSLTGFWKPHQKRWLIYRMVAVWVSQR